MRFSIFALALSLFCFSATSCSKKDDAKPKESEKSKALKEDE